MSATRIGLGKRGEQLAAEFYIREGYRILEQNFRSPIGEVDLIVEKSGLLVFVEVKSRSSELFGEGYEAVNKAKQARLRRLATLYLRQTRLSYSGIRFDVVSLLITREGELIKLKHFSAAF